MTEDMRRKILELFEYRRLPEIITEGNGTMDEMFYDKLIALQNAIYELDEVLETEWLDNRAHLDDKWALINKHLLDLGVAESDLPDYTYNIKTYEKHELDIRRGKMPMQLDIEYFYYFKSCDVKLIRRLIYDRYPHLADSILLEDWRLFDLVTEVNDDVEDLYEDFETINGNRFLLSLAHFGRDRTARYFHNFLDDIDYRNAEVESFEGIINPKLMTSEQVEETKALLENRLWNYDSVALMESKVMEYL